MQLMECPAEDDYVTSVAWAADGKHVSVGTSSAQVQVGCEGHPSHCSNMKPPVAVEIKRCLLPSRHSTSVLQF